MKHRSFVFAGVALSALLTITTRGLAQDSTIANLPGGPLKAYFGVIPYTDASSDEALVDSLATATVPLSKYSIHSTKDLTTRRGTIVGTSPFVTPLAGTLIYADLVPVIINIQGGCGIGTNVCSVPNLSFDPTAPNSCDGNVSALARFQSSPLFQNVPNLTIDNVNVGNVQYVNGVRRAEFWNLTGPNTAYSNPISYTVTAPSTITVPDADGFITFDGPCSELGHVDINWLNTYLTRTLIPSLKKSGEIATTNVVIFLLQNVVEYDAPPIAGFGGSGCCIVGYHSAHGRPAQFYMVVDWDTTALFGPTISDAVAASRELAEFMDDPLGTNPTPAWGNIGQVAGCQHNLEVGDPLNGTDMPLSFSTFNGYPYHLQELAFFSWFFNYQHAPSIGAGGKFSTNGTLAGPAKACPPGGTF